MRNALTYTGEIAESEVKNIVYFNTAQTCDWRFHPHTHAYSELTFIVSGSGILTYEGIDYPLCAGDYVLTAPGTTHAERNVKGATLEQISMGLSDLNLLSDRRYCVFNEDKRAITKKMFSYLIRTVKYFIEIRESAYGGEAARLFDFIPLAMKVLQDEPYASAEGSHSELVRKILHYLEENFMKDISIETASKTFGVSVSTIYKNLSAEIGVPFQSLLTDRRIGEAEQLLLFHDYSLKEISKVCGYHSVSYFHKAFKRASGFTPLEFRDFYDVSRIYRMVLP